MARRTYARTARRTGHQAQKTMQENGGETLEQARLGIEGMEAAVQSTASVTGAAQTVGTEWLAYFQGAAFRNIRTMTQLAHCRTMQDLMEAQTSRLAEEFGEFAECSRRISERLLEATEDAAGGGRAS